jgi:hypothetical protein
MRKAIINQVKKCLWIHQKMKLKKNSNKNNKKLSSKSRRAPKKLLKTKMMRINYHPTKAMILMNTHHNMRHHKIMSWVKWTLTANNKDKVKESLRKSWEKSQDNKEFCKSKVLT